MTPIIRIMARHDPPGTGGEEVEVLGVDVVGDAGGGGVEPMQPRARLSLRADLPRQLGTRSIAAMTAYTFELRARADGGGRVNGRPARRRVEPLPARAARRRRRRQARGVRVVDHDEAPGADEALAPDLAVRGLARGRAAVAVQAAWPRAVEPSGRCSAHIRMEKRITANMKYAKRRLKIWLDRPWLRPPSKLGPWFIVPLRL
jgi:hypothetical protein